MTEIISKLDPPTLELVFEWLYQTKDGRVISYKTGTGNLTEHQRKRECGGCTFCIGEVQFSVNKQIRFGSSHPKFRRWPCEPCDKCKPVLEKLNSIEATIRDLNEEKRKLEQ